MRAASASLVVFAALTLACPRPPGGEGEGEGEPAGEGEGEARDCSYDDLVAQGSVLTPQELSLPEGCLGVQGGDATNAVHVATTEEEFQALFRCSAPDGGTIDSGVFFGPRYAAALVAAETERLVVVVDVDGVVTFALSDPGGCRGAQPAYAPRYLTFTGGPWTGYAVDVCVERPCTCGGEGDPCPP